MVFLWTDILIWLLLFSTVGLGFVISKSKETRAKWREIFKSKLAIVSAIVLSFYLIYALLDSIHLRDNTSSNIVSLLDIALKHRAESRERTYSSPFALREYIKDIDVDESGITREIYRDLKFVNGGNFTSNTILGILVGLSISLIFIFLNIRYIE